MMGPLKNNDELMSKHECLIMPRLRKPRGPKFVLASQSHRNAHLRNAMFRHSDFLRHSVIRISSLDRLTNENQTIVKELG
jgi:hypothetical protein